MKPTLAAFLLVLSAILFHSCEDSMDAETLSTQNIDNVIPESPAAPEEVFEYTFTGQEGDPISLETAQQWMNNYNVQNPGAVRAHFFGHEIIQQILTQEGAVGIRIYYALDDRGNKQLLLIGATATGDDMLPDSELLDGGGGYSVADASFPCPSFCNK